MSSGKFVHLHLHTQYSLLDGANKIPNILERAHALGQPAIAMTDHGNLHGALEFYLAGKNIGINPIIGCELYVTPGSRLDKRTRQQGGAGTYHLTVLAQNNTGYSNLCKLSTLAYKEGFYFKPRVDHELLEEFSEGLIVLSGCITSELSAFAEAEEEKKAKVLAEKFSSIFKGRYFLEIQPHQIPEQQKANQLAIELSKSLGIPLVATNDCHYSTIDDHHAQDVLMCISTGTQVNQADRLRHEGFRLHLKTFDEMKAELGEGSYVDEALENSVDIAKRCEVSFNTSTHYMPVFKTEEKCSLVTAYLVVL